MSLRDWAEYLAFVAVGPIVRVLPVEWLQRGIAPLARWYFNRGGKSAREALLNLELAFPDLSEAERRRIGRESYVNFAWNAIDWVRGQAWSDAEVISRVEIHGRERIEKARTRGRGVFIFTLHMGNFELAGRAFGVEIGEDFAIVGREQRNKLLWKHVVRLRGGSGAEIIDRRNAATRMLRALRKNRVVTVMIDQYSRRTRGVFVPLFGKRCSTSAGVATLALRTGAAIVPAFTYRDGPDHHVVYFEPEIELVNTGDRKHDIEASTAEFNRWIEDVVRRHPEHWLWSHRRFRHSPDLPENPYRERR